MACPHGYVGAAKENECKPKQSQRFVSSGFTPYAVETLPRKKAVSRPAEIPKPQTSAVPASIRQVSQKPDLSSVPTQSTHLHDQTRKTTSRDGVAVPLKHDGERTTRDFGFPSPQTPTESQMTTLVRPTVQHSMTVPLDMAAAIPEQWRTMPPLPSTSYPVSPSGNVTSAIAAPSHPAHLREISLVPSLLFWTTCTYPLTNDCMFQPLARTPPSQPTGLTYVQAHSQSFKPTSASGSVGPALAKSEPMDIDIDQPTLDLHALTLTRTTGASSGFSFHRKTTSRPHSPPPPPSSTRVAAAEDDEIEDLYGPPLGLASVHAPPPLPPREPSPRSLQPPEPAPAEPRLLPALAAEDPRMLATLERHERREAARARQGMHKAQAVRRVGAKRGGFVLVADHRTEAEATVARARPIDPCREPRGVFASYFARSKA